MIFFCLLLLSVLSFDCSQKEDVGLYEDRYYWPGLHLSSHFYSEWWYFTFYSSKNDVGGIIEIETVNPSSKKEGYSVLSVTLFEHKSSLMFMEKYGVNEMVCSRNNATCSIPTGSLEVVSEDVYKINLKPKSFPVQFNLVLEKAGIEGIVQHPGFEPLFYFGYVSYMPIGKIKGNVKIKGNEYEFSNDILFHDHQYGTWFPLFQNTCGWGQYGNYDMNFAIVWGFDKLPILGYAGYVYLRIGKGVSETIGTSCLDKFEITVNETKESKESEKLIYASIYTLEVSNSKYRVVVKVNETRVYEEKNGIKKRKRKKVDGDDDIDFVIISFCEALVYDEGKLIIQSNGYGFNVWPSAILSS